MAPEALEAQSQETSVPSEPEATIKVESTSENGFSDRPLVNGDAASTATDDVEHKQISEIIDELVNSAEVSTSGGSDNEASKSDAIKLKENEKGHVRSSSGVKKLASFKSINVNKTFAAKTNAPIPSPKLSEKVTPATAATSVQTTPASGSRPRLVAKTGSTLVAKSATGTNGGKGGSKLDGNAVWNKNRPAPVPDPKKYTDEELKDKYSIHIAERLDTDHAKGQSNWADIEDDDEDWAPDSITWKDGTKITIPHTEEPAPAASERAMLVDPKHNGIPETSKSPLSTASLAVKPGVLGSGRGLVLKGVSEKPTLVSKPPPPPTPVKSPWATVPKVASPVVVVEAPIGSRQGLRDGAGLKSMTIPPPMAADDFNRSTYRDPGASASRELYNAQSGQYESVGPRRATLRTEQSHGRHPALLQRSSQVDHQGPAEPSAAFQTHRTSDQHGSWGGRRRTSSTVSGGSGIHMHRLTSHEHFSSHDVGSGRPDSVNGGSEAAASPVPMSAHHAGHFQGPHPWQPHPSPSLSDAKILRNQDAAETPAPPSAQQPAVVVHDQKELMKRARDAAIRRREEEAREEAAKKERIQKKLEELGPAPESKSEKRAREARKRLERPAASAAQAVDDDDATGQAAKPRAEEKRGAGVTKILETDGQVSREASEGVQPVTTPDKRRAGVPDGPGQDTQESQAQSQGSTHAHPWPSETKQPPTWGSQANKNVWGPPSNNRTLGNGTFDAEFANAQATQTSRLTPGPIAPPSGVRNTAPVPAPSARPAPIAPPKPAPGTKITIGERSTLQNHWSQAVKQNDQDFQDMLSSHFEARDRRLREEGRTLKDSQPAMKDTWRPVKLDEDGHRENVTKKAVVKSTVGTSAWGQTSASGKHDGASTANAKAKPDAKDSAPKKAHVTQDDGGKGVQTENTTPPSLATSAAAQSRTGSRFFPARDVRLESQPSSHQRQKSPSPPPPDMVGHPAFDGDSTHPHVSLPKSRPVVRLPPALEVASTVASTRNPPVASHGVVHAAHAPWGNATARRDEDHGPAAAWGPVGPKPVSIHGHAHHQGNWQARIDNLLGAPRKCQPPPKTFGAEQSRLSTGYPSLSSGGEWVVSRLMAEECFEEQEMGSLPTVRVPSKAPARLWPPYPVPRYHPLPKKFHVVGTTIEVFVLSDMSVPHGSIRVSLPGQNARTVPMSSRTGSNPRRDGRGASRGGNGRHSSAAHRGPKGRDSSLQASDQASGTSASTAGHRSGRGGFRARDNWSRANNNNTTNHSNTSNAAAVQT